MVFNLVPNSDALAQHILSQFHRERMDSDIRLLTVHCYSLTAVSKEQGNIPYMEHHGRP